LVRLETEQLAGGHVDISDAPLRVRDDDAFLDRIEDRLDEPFLLREPQQIMLHVFRPNLAEATDQLVEKAGLHGG